MPTIEIPDKICPHCGGNKWITKKSKNGKYRVTSCFLKAYEYGVAYKATEHGRQIVNNYAKTEAAKKHKKKYLSKEPAKLLRAASLKKSTAKYKVNNPEKIKELKKRYSKKSRERLINSIVKSYLANNNSGLKYSDIPQELIELKRKQLLLTRTIRNNGN